MVITFKIEQSINLEDIQKEGLITFGDVIEHIKQELVSNNLDGMKFVIDGKEGISKSSINPIIEKFNQL